MKNSYRISNWSKYNKSLINRGSITFWFSQDSIDKWFAKKDKNHFGRPFVFSDFAIETATTIRFVYNLNLRALEGFVSSLITLLHLPIKAPSYTQVCRRMQKISLPQKLIKSGKRITDIVFDASGLKLYGEGEWKVKIHGKSKRRIWRKIHFGINPKTHEIILTELTDNACNDGQIMRRLLEKMGKLKKVYGDGAYDNYECYQAINSHGAEALIPVRKRGKYQHKIFLSSQQRNQQILDVLALGNDDVARSLWKKLKGYHRRSLVETAFFRFKTILGSSLKSRKLINQKVESTIKCIILNKMTQLGMPASHPI